MAYFKFSLRKCTHRTNTLSLSAYSYAIKVLPSRYLLDTQNVVSFEGPKDILIGHWQPHEGFHGEHHRAHPFKISFLRTEAGFSHLEHIYWLIEDMEEWKRKRKKERGTCWRALPTIVRGIVQRPKHWGGPTVDVHLHPFHRAIFPRINYFHFSKWRMQNNGRMNAKSTGISPYKLFYPCFILAGISLPSTFG